MSHTIGRKLRADSSRYLCICQGGNVRSAALATVFKQRHHHDALALGYERCSTVTLTLLCAWADTIVVMHAPYTVVVPATYQSKVVVCDVGPDTYGSPTHPDLVAQVVTWATAYFA
jgi:predicted protein tyrosine phosphatase